MNQQKIFIEKIPGFYMRAATPGDVGILLAFIRELAEYEERINDVVATEEILLKNLFTERKAAEAILGFIENTPVSFAVFFHNFSTFLGRPGIYLEDLYVVPDMRNRGIGRAMIAYIARLAVDRECGRLDWWVLDSNHSAIEFYRSLGAKSMSEWTVQRVEGRSLTDLANSFSHVNDSPEK